jgi:predicted nucleotidyltransferase
VDLLVEFEAGREAIEAELSAMLGGRPADPRTRQDLRRYFRDEVERTAEVEYAA